MPNNRLGLSPKERAATSLGPLGFYHPAALAADATKEWPVFRAPFNGRIARIDWIPRAAVTGANTNSFTLHVFNRGAANAGTTDISGTGVAFVSGTNAVANTPIALVTADTTVAAGDVLAFQREKVGTGLATPEGTVVVVFAADDWL